MRPQNSRSEYERRMHRVLEYIDQHLDQPLNLEKLADEAYFSAFHFHRLFSAWMGETIGDYVRRRRVEVAAMRLAAQPRVTVLSTALSVGFGSAEAFARAFKIRFGRSPTAWREQQIVQRSAVRHHDGDGNENRNPDQTNSKMSQEVAAFSLHHEVSHQSHKEMPMMNVKLEDLPPVTIAYLRYTGPYGAAVGAFWRNAYLPWAAAHNLLDRVRYGISHDDPSITAPEQCRYDACCEVPSDFIATENPFKTTLPGGRYATLRFMGTSDQIGAAWAALMRDWLPSSGLQLDARPCFECYPRDAAYDPQTGAFECDICIPVMPL
jgi:AraC family transcriptional regulator